MSNINNNFSFSRFGAYLNKLLVERWRTSVMRVGILFGSMLMIEFLFSISSYDKYTSSDRGLEILFVCYAISLLVSGSIFASDLMSGARRKAERISALAFPVTPFENWLARWVICVPLYLVTYLVCMYAAETLRVVLVGSVFSNIELHFVPIFAYSDFPGSDLSPAWLLYFWVTAVYVVGSVFFARRPTLKTTMLLFLMFWGGFLTLFFGGHYLDYSYSLLIRSLYWFAWLSVPFLWWLSYLGFKDLEVIDEFSFKRSKVWIVGYFVCALVMANVGIWGQALGDAKSSYDDVAEDGKGFYLDRTIEKRIAPVTVIAYNDSSNADYSSDNDIAFNDIAFTVEVNYVNDASQCSVIYPDEVLKVWQKDNVLYYALSDSVQPNDGYYLKFLYGPDGKADVDEAVSNGKIVYQVKGIDGKVRKVLDRNYDEKNKARIIVNTLPGALVVNQPAGHNVYIGTGKTRSITVNSKGELKFTSAFKLDSLVLNDVYRVDLNSAQINVMKVQLGLDPESEYAGDTEFLPTDKAMVNHVEVVGSGEISQIDDVRFKQLVLLPSKGGNLNIELKNVKRKMVVQGQE